MKVSCSEMWSYIPHSGAFMPDENVNRVKTVPTCLLNRSALMSAHKLSKASVESKNSRAAQSLCFQGHAGSYSGFMRGWAEYKSLCKHIAQVRLLYRSSKRFQFPWDQPTSSCCNDIDVFKQLGLWLCGGEGLPWPNCVLGAGGQRKLSEIMTWMEA